MGVTARGSFLLIFHGLVCCINRDIETLEPEGDCPCAQSGETFLLKDLKISQNL
ncbi:hypothetical protein CY34DRAFT_800901 [Suillus luteus UH-Slu-Lm8-n1]|uniref:Uncharacterized protein n=1 Tax=Suillus luteus UH-Slu-Lm8-n1 TaxID=930992 RepID=A0A0D0BSQ6_9AGAM|nr:hypothetical protein CY34DRAFT_800901 [Suillus luteus UH-Slu-Lm8-n1]